MMRRLFGWIGMALCFGALLTGCGSDNDSTPAASSETTLTTTLALAADPPPAGAPALMRAAARAAATITATVTLTLPDGTKYTMTDNGSGGYSCTVKDFPTGSPFVIDAHAGDLVLKNFFASLPAGGDLGETNPMTTLATDILAAFVGALDANKNFPSASELLAAVSGATLSIDIATLKAQVADTNDTTYEELRQVYETVLTVSNQNSGTSSEELIVTDPVYTETVTSIESGGITPPYTSDADNAKAVVIQFFEAMLLGDKVKLAAGLASEGFLWSGKNAEQLLAAEIADDEFGFLSGATNITKDFSKTVVEPGPVANSWWVYMGAKVSYTLDNMDYQFNFSDKTEQYTAILVKKDSAGKFAIYGDQKKVEYNWDLGWNQEQSYVNQGVIVTPDTPNTYIAIWAEVTDTIHFPLSAATLSGTAFTGNLPLVTEPGDDLNERSLWFPFKWNGVLKNPETIWIYNSSTDMYDDLPVPTTAAIEGSNITFKNTFLDNSTETFTVKLPAAVTPVYPTIAAPVSNLDGTMTISWTDISKSLPGGGEVNDISVRIVDDQQNGWYDIMEIWGIVPGTNSVTVPAQNLLPGKIYLIDIEVYDLHGRGYRSRLHFTAPVLAPA